MTSSVCSYRYSGLFLFKSRPGSVTYPDKENANKSYYTVKNVVDLSGVLMGEEGTKELLHALVYIASGHFGTPLDEEANEKNDHLSCNPNLLVRIINFLTLILGDDLFGVSNIEYDFHDDNGKSGLRTNQKADYNTGVVVTDRFICMCEENGIYSLCGSFLLPPKVLALKGKTTGVGMLRMIPPSSSSKRRSLNQDAVDSPPTNGAATG